MIDGTGYQFTQARGLIVIDSPVGLVAVLPIGMGQVSSVNLTAQVGAHLAKGEEFGYFAFGGSDAEKDREAFLERLYRNTAESVIRCGDDQNVQYKGIFVGCKIEWIPEGYVGCALTCAPYVVLARKVVPAGEKPDVLVNLTLSEWEKAIGLSPLKENPDKP